MATDAAFLEEVSAFLDKSGIHVPLEPVQEDRTCASAAIYLNWVSVSSGIESISSHKKRKTDTSRAIKRKLQREKEVLRKQRYQERLKSERESLRLMVSELSTQVEKLKWRRRSDKGNNGDVQNLPWRKLANYEHQQRQLAEMEQKKLITAVGIQASYINTLQRALPGDSSIPTDFSWPTLT
ncbi:hypothetical protein F442_13264 [Phytophthora nicotianae P10297]|uniref:Uncharacterized protein n=2 Tax=Phytophthora nicotianae TaxID=4792 RepID=W2YW81_PHYNI|nr:hypothetical protein L917_12820 [Phytophthora nicotianae]ETP39263.1 hypothetical protein F442_13264 [Phytophthora nicotianae P10297]